MKRMVDIRVTDTLQNNDTTDAALMRGMRDGDISAFEQVYYRWNKQVYAFIFKTTHSTSDTEDITQEVFIRLWKMRENIDPQKSIQALIFTIARRITVDMYRRGGKIAVMLSGETEEEVEDSAGGSPQEILEEQETQLLLEIAIENMPEKQRKVFILYMKNFSPQEIALQLGLTYDNVRKHIYNGKQQLREVVPIIIY